ncbi:MAG: long-chain fatty acid--CoA ligase, partial [Proteobacteria bacterium]|nr:long-chain fatty acid--CoA ligase [Pseudomonadota bacterium]
MYSERFWKKNWDEGLDDITPQEYETTYVEMIKDAFRSFPEKTALAYLGVTITFGELDKYANQFANMLVENGFEKGDVVGINLPNTPQYLISLIGTLRAGCIVSGVSPLMSADQIKYQLNDLSSTGKKVALVTLDAIFAGHLVNIADDIPGLKLVVVTNPASFLPKIKQVLGKLLKKVPTGKVTPLRGKTVLDLHKDVFSKVSTEFKEVEVGPDDLGWIQYTGGTTGAPKGAMLSHKNASHNILGINRWLGWERGKGVLLSGFPMFHIAGLTVCECAIFLGWSQVLIPNPRDTDNICAEIEQYKPTNLVNVPSLYQMLMANPKFSELDHSGLGICVSAASPFPKESQMELEKIIGQGKLLELYGMTETSPVATMNPSKGTKKLGTIGLPFVNTDFKLLSTDTGEEVPLGEPGEICVKGPLVMQGYFNKPDKTKEAIDPDGYMHTGDVGIMDEDGYVRIVDRTKDMIIVGGFKVFSSKVEDILSNHPAVGVMALIGVDNPDRPGSELVKAFVQLDPVYKYDGNAEALTEDIVKFAKEKCSPYEVPKEIEIVEEIPLTTVGKVD